MDTNDQLQSSIISYTNSTCLHCRWQAGKHDANQLDGKRLEHYDTGFDNNEYDILKFGIPGNREHQTSA